MTRGSNDTLGIIFPNTYDALNPELTSVRLMASVPFASRYRLVDFVLSSMSRNGIDNVFVMVNKNYHSLIDHLGSGREWDLVRKSGGLHVFPPYAVGTSKPYVGRVGALAGLLDILRGEKEEFVVISDSNFAANLDFKAIVNEHIETGADVTIVYNEQEFPESLINMTDNSRGFYYTFDIKDGRVKKIYVNEHNRGIHNFSMNVYVLRRELLIELINTAYVRGLEFFERDILLPHLDKYYVHGYKHEGYVARITDIKSYYEENMKLLDEKNLEALFAAGQVYTKIRDDNPTRYAAGSKVTNIMAADGCVIEGEVENSVLFRGVKIAKGAKVKNCVIMQDTEIKEGAELEYVIIDKDVVVSAGKSVKGSDSFPVYVPKGRKI